MIDKDLQYLMDAEKYDNLNISLAKLRSDIKSDMVPHPMGDEFKNEMLVHIEKLSEFLNELSKELKNLNEDLYGTDE